MEVSTYQMERLLRRLTRWVHWPARRTQSGEDRYSPSGEVRERSQAKPPPRLRPTASAAPEPTPRPPVVAEELERRAGSFMKPPYPQPPRPSHVPRLRKAGKSQQSPE